MTTFNKILKAVAYCALGFFAVVGASGVWMGVKESIIEKHAKKLEAKSSNESKNIG